MVLDRVQGDDVGYTIIVKPDFFLHREDTRLEGCFQISTTSTGIGGDDAPLVYLVNVGYEMQVANDVDGGAIVQQES